MNCMTSHPIAHNFPSSPGYGNHVLIASPSTVVRQRVLESLRSPVRRFEQATGGAEALVHLESGSWQVLFLDRKLPDLDAEELSLTVRQRYPGIQVVMLDSEQRAEQPSEENAGAVEPLAENSLLTPAWRTWPDEALRKVISQNARMPGMSPPDSAPDSLREPVPPNATLLGEAERGENPECEGALGHSPLEAFQMLPLNYVASSNTLYLAFGERVDHAALYAIEKILDCRTVPCVAGREGIARKLDTMRQLSRPSDVEFGPTSGLSEMARIASSYTARLSPAQVRLSRVGRFIWLRLDVKPNTRSHVRNLHRGVEQSSIERSPRGMVQSKPYPITTNLVFRLPNDSPRPLLTRAFRDLYPVNPLQTR